MNRTTLLQDRRMEKFEELLKRWQTGSCRVPRPGSFGLFGTAVPPLPTAYEEDGLDGLVDQRLQCHCLESIEFPATDGWPSGLRHRS